MLAQQVPYCFSNMPFSFLLNLLWNIIAIKIHLLPYMKLLLYFMSFCALISRLKIVRLKQML
jgi:hypothetical protein